MHACLQPLRGDQDTVGPVLNAVCCHDPAAWEVRGHCREIVRIVPEEPEVLLPNLNRNPLTIFARFKPVLSARL